MTVRPEVVLAHLATLGEMLAVLRQLAGNDVDLRRDPLRRLALERALHVAAEAVFDIGHHVLAGRAAAVPAKYRDVLPALSRAGIIPDELATRLAGLAGLRNVLVHDYARIDHTLLWGLVDDRLDDLQALADVIASLRELGSPPA